MLGKMFVCALATLPLFGEEEECFSGSCNRGFYGCEPDPTAVPAQDCQPKEPCFSACACHEGPSVGIASVRHREPGGIGYNEGYTSVDLFYLLDSGQCFPFIDLRSHVFNDGKLAYNIGGGIRYLSSCRNFATGLNLYYDYRDAEHTNFHALGAGAEFLWPGWSISINGYAPISRHKKSYKVGFTGFKGHTAHFYKKYETAMSGFDVSVNWELFRYIPAAVCPHGDGSLVGDVIFGGYYFIGDYGETAGGGLLKFRLTVSRHFFAEGQISYDNQFKWRGQGEAGLRFPFGPPVRRADRLISECIDLIALEEKLADKPERFEIIVTTNHKKKARARNAFTGAVQNFVFVSPNGGSDGSFESPFATVDEGFAAASPRDVIYLLAGDGSGIPLSSPTVQFGQTLLGSGTSFPFKTGFGMATLPALTKQLPVVSMVSGRIDLASNNTIAGVDFRVDANLDALAFGDKIQDFNFLFNRVRSGSGFLQEIIVIESSGLVKLVGNSFEHVGSPIFGVSIAALAGEIYANSFNPSTTLPAVQLFSTGGPVRFFIEQNRIVDPVSAIAPSVFLNVTLSNEINNLIRNNRTGEMILEMPTGLLGASFPFTIKNNVIVLTNPPVSGGVVLTGNNVNGKLFGNVMTGVGPVIQLDGPLNSVQSPNLQISGIEAMNEGSVAITTPAQVTFIPFE